jgi:acyl carrier protein
MTTFERVRDLIAAEFGLPADNVTPQTALVDLGVDSLAALEFAFALEDAFHVHLAADVDLSHGRIADLVTAIERAPTVAGAPVVAG